MNIQSLLWQRLTWASYIVLIGALLLGGVISGTPLVLIIAATAPLLLFIPGMRRGSPRSLVMLCFATLLYFTAITVNLFEPDRSFFDIVALTAVCTLFTAAMLLSRQLARLQNTRTESPPAASTTEKEPANE